jgi:hypothetical protein
MTTATDQAITMDLIQTAARKHAEHRRDLRLLVSALQTEIAELRVLVHLEELGNFSMVNT